MAVIRPDEEAVIDWPVVAQLSCGHFKAFSVARSPHLGQWSFCVLCSTAGLGSLRLVEAAVSVPDLMRHSNELAEIRRAQTGDDDGVEPFETEPLMGRMLLVPWFWQGIVARVRR